MLLDGTVSFASSHDEERMADPAVTALRQRIDLVGAPDRERRTAVVEVALRDGGRLSESQTAVRGTPDNPMTTGEVEAKAHDLIAPITGEKNSRNLIELIGNIENVEDARVLRPLLMA